MSLAELLPAVRGLSRAEKLRLIQFVAAELVQSEDLAGLEAGQTYEVWSPYDAHEAAEILKGMLDKEKSQP